MSENNKTYRVRTKIGVTANSPVEDQYLTVNLTDRVDTIEIMSLKIKQENAYKFHSADYGVVVGRAIANGGFGVPNVKVSVFIAASDATKNDAIYNAIYPYTSVTSKNSKNIRYNLLPDEGDDDCYQVVGTFPNKRLVLDDDNYMEIYDNYYKFTTRTNNAGDYMIFGIPVGGQILHFDTDLSDVGVLSQKPRDMIYKGYNINQFENANQFKVDDNLANLPQIISQDDSVYVYPFWGDESENIIGITRHDIDINYKFEPTCVFIGSIVSDSNSNHISKKCIPTEAMGLMEEMITGSGTIEMIRKKQDGTVEQFNIQGTQLIDENGVWCYQIPMNLDYAMTDEYGNLIPSDDPTKGIATRTSVRFRISMQDFENDSANSFRTKVLVPNNPQNSTYTPDYVFGSFTEDESFRDLLWNNVYTVKSFIPRFQKGNGQSNRRFSGIKQCNYHGQNNPIPYNNMRINLSFQFIITCLIVKLLIWAVGVYNAFITAFSNVLCVVAGNNLIKNISKSIDAIDNWRHGGKTVIGRIVRETLGALLWTLTLPFRIIKVIADFFIRVAKSLSCLYLDGEMCEQLEGSWYFAPNCGTKKTVSKDPNNYVWKNMMAKVEDKKMSELDFSKASSKDGGGMVDKKSIDSSNALDVNDEESMVTIKYEEPVSGETGGTYSYVITRGLNYFMQCIEISLAQEFRVVQFDFYNDWINGMVYIPRWERSIRKKRRFFLFGKSKIEVKACNDTYTKRFFERKNNLTEQCGVSYRARTNENSVGTPVGCKNNKKYKCHKKKGRRQVKVFNDGGVVHEEQTASGLYAYYFRPCEYVTNRNKGKNRKINLFATDIVLLGSLVDCDINGTPLFTNELTSTSYQLPSPLAHTDSTEEGFTYTGEADKTTLLDDPRFAGVYDYSDSILNPKDDGSVTEESGIDWGYVGPGQGIDKKNKAYTPGGHFLGISCTNSESSIKSCVNLKRICEVGVWPSQRQEVFNGYDAGLTGRYLDIIPHGLIAKDDISDGNFRKLFSTMNKNGLRTKVNASGFTVYDFEYLSPENFGGEMAKYTKTNYNEANPLNDEAMDHYFAKNADDVDEDGVKWIDFCSGQTYTEAESLNIKPIRRALDDRDSDYMRFRLGLETGTNGEIQKKYLGSDDYGFYMPVYNNSFYFYFGLVPGSTALEEFHKQFFAECKQTISTEDLRLKLSLSYNEYGIPDVFARGFNGRITISIFDDKAMSNNSDSLKIFSSSVPIKIIVDSDPNKTITIGPDSQTQQHSNVYTEFSCSDYGSMYHDLFDFEIGKHTISVMDSDGRSVTELVEVVRQEVVLCPKVTPVDFTDENYIVNSTARLVNGDVTGVDRETLGGWFNFEWGAKSSCPESGDCANAIFKYHDAGAGEDICVSDDECTMLFVSSGKIIKVGNWSDTKILAYEEFAGYAEPFEGTHVDEPTYHVYAGEAANYSLYVLYNNGSQETPSPILLAEGLEVGEPAAIDFDIFRDVAVSEEDSPITFRNSLIKIWYYHQPDWFDHIYDEVDGAQEISFDQIWYLRKNSFYVVSASTSPEVDLNENFTSDRDMYVNPFYPANVGRVACFITPSGGSESETSVFHVSGDSTWDIFITGASIDVETGADTMLRTPFGTSTFTFPVFYKPYYYKAVVWEGYSVFEGTGQLARNGQVNGMIYNGVVYDYIEDGELKQKFGPTMLNDMYDISDSVSVQTDQHDLNNNPLGRITPISFVGDEMTFSDATNSLLITEGSPKYYENSYTPVEYVLETNVVGGTAMWDIFLNINKLGDEDSGATLTIACNDVFEYETVTCLFGLNKPLDGRREGLRNQQEAIETVKIEDLASSGYGLGVMGGTQTEVTFSLPFDEDGSGSIPSGTILLESMVKDKFRYSPTDVSLGFLSSRNFIRNGINIDYSIDDERCYLYFTVGIDPMAGQGDVQELEDMAAIGGFYLKLPFSDESFVERVGPLIYDIILSFDSDPDTEYRMVEDMGYTFDYKGGFNTTVLNETEGGKIDASTAVHDRLTSAIFDLIEEKGGELKDFDEEITITLIETSFGGLGELGSDFKYNDSIDMITTKYKGHLVFTEIEEASEEGNG